MKGKAKMGSITKKGLVLALAAVALAGCATSPVPTTKDTEAFASRLIADKVAVAADAQREYVALVNEDKSVLSVSRRRWRRTKWMSITSASRRNCCRPSPTATAIATSRAASGSICAPSTTRVQKTPPIEVLRNIGYQVDAAADVVLDKNAKTLRLIYKNLPANKG
ncbi:hypothetical protein [Aeromonas veronii]|uniref:hypothetical protein n=1 Tax=Aeromonas veronii TaxID=654 RepID=UPI001F0B5AAB|nr:hypothetical protein [Aeromonas veronii]